MAKDITITNPGGTEIYYPKTVSQLVYDNNNGTTVAAEISALQSACSEFLTESEITTLVEGMISGNLTRKVVSSLPSIGQANVLYIVPSGSAYLEYLYIDGAWRQVGQSETDLTDYYKKSEVNTLISGKVDKVQGKGLSSNDFTDSYKDLIEEVNGKSHSHTNKAILDGTTASYTVAEKNKLGAIEAGAQKNVTADWNTTSPLDDSYIANKPTVVSAFTNDAGYIGNEALADYYKKSETLSNSEINELLDGKEDVQEEVTIDQYYNADRKLQKLFSIGTGNVVLEYKYTIAGRSWCDRLYYSATDYPKDGYFRTENNIDFIENRSSVGCGPICIQSKEAEAAPSVQIMFKVIFSDTNITWYTGTNSTDFVEKTGNAVNNSKISISQETIDESSSKTQKLTIASNGTISPDPDLLNKTDFIVDNSANATTSLSVGEDWQELAIYRFSFSNDYTLNITATGAEYFTHSGKAGVILTLTPVYNSTTKTYGFYYDEQKSDENSEKIKELEEEVLEVAQMTETLYEYVGTKVTSISSSSTDSQFPTAKAVNTKLGDYWSINDLDGFKYQVVEDSTSGKAYSSHIFSIRDDVGDVPSGSDTLEVVNTDKTTATTAEARTFTDDQVPNMEMMKAYVRSCLTDVTITIS